MIASLRAVWAATTPARKLAIALTAFGLVSAAATLLVLVPVRARTVALEARLTVLEPEMVQARDAVRDLFRHRRERVQQAQRLEAIGRKLPIGREIPRLYRNTYEAAFATGLAVTLFQPRDPRWLDYYAEIPISITAEGTYHQLGKFFERLAAFPRIVTVSGFKMSRLDRPGASIRADVTLTTYVYRPASPAAPTPATVPKAIAAARSSPSAFPAREPRASAAPAYSSRGRRDPFGGVLPPRVEEPPATARHRSSIASARLTGIVRGPQGLLALVELPDGIGHVLRQGDGIGEARLLRIDKDAVVFETPARPGLIGEQIVLALGRAR